MMVRSKRMCTRHAKNVNVACARIYANNVACACARSGGIQHADQLPRPANPANIIP